MSDPVRLRAWDKFPWKSPLSFLGRMETLVDYAQGSSHQQVRNLRRNDLRHISEAGDAAIFTFLMGKLVLKRDILFAPVEHEDFDFGVAYEHEETRHYVPVQLKELVPENLNPKQTLEDLLNKLSKYASSAYTKVAIKLNRETTIDFSKIVVPDVPFSEIWLFGASSPDFSKWFLFGNLLNDPVLYEYVALAEGASDA